MNVLENSYAVKAVLKDGTTLDLTPAVTSLGWQDPPEEIAQRATIRLAQVKTARGYLNSLLPLCTLILIYANGEEVFRGIVWEWEYESSNKREITLTCYDHFIYAENSKTFSYFPAGKSTRDMVQSICSAAGIKLEYTYDSIKHAKTIYRSRTIADQILDTLDEAALRQKTDPVAIFEKQTLKIGKEGTNKDVFVFKASDSAISTTERLTMAGLVTKVVIYGTEDSADRRRVEATVNGKTEYGNLQDIILRNKSTTLASAREEASKILAEDGLPKKTITVEAPDVPQIRKGWKIRMSAGSLLGYYIVKGVTHNAADRTMTMELKTVQ